MRSKILFISITNFIFGFIISFIVFKSDASLYKIDTNINIFDIINLIVTSSIAIAIGWYITKRFTESRYVKEYTIKEIYNYADHLRIIEKQLYCGKVEIKEIIPFLTELTFKLEKLINTINTFHININGVEKLKEHRRLLYMALSDIDENKLALNEIKLTQVKEVLNLMDIEIKRLIYIINAL